jgi:hypothetical protein
MSPGHTGNEVRREGCSICESVQFVTGGRGLAIFLRFLRLFPLAFISGRAILYVRLGTTVSQRAADTLAVGNFAFDRNES